MPFKPVTMTIEEITIQIGLQATDQCRSIREVAHEHLCAARCISTNADLPADVRKLARAQAEALERYSSSITPE